MNYYRHYLGDYQRDTADLSLIEHGAYRLLLDACYATEGPLPADYTSLYRVTRAMDSAEKAAVRRMADRFFPVRNDGLRHNDRADREIPQAQKRIETAQANGKNGGRKPKRKPSGLPKTEPNGNPAGSDSGAQRVYSPSTNRNTPVPGEDDLGDGVVVIPWGGRA